MSDDARTQHAAATPVAPPPHARRSQHNMRRYGSCVALAVMLAGIIAVAPAPATKPATRPTTQLTARSAPARAVAEFRDALKSNQLTQASGHLAQSPQPVRDADRRLKRLAASLSSAKWDFSILDATESGDVAVVLVNDHLKDGRKTIDIKPWYLIRQQGEWKLLAKFTDFELKEYGFDQPRLAEYQKLEKWSEQREPELRKDLPGCGGC